MGQGSAAHGDDAETRHAPLALVPAPAFDFFQQEKCSDPDRAAAHMSLGLKLVSGSSSLEFGSQIYGLESVSDFSHQRFKSPNSRSEPLIVFVNFY